MVTLNGLVLNSHGFHINLSWAGKSNIVVVIWANFVSTERFTGHGGTDTDTGFRKVGVGGGGGGFWVTVDY